MKRKKIISVNINAIKYADALKEILALGSKHVQSYICFVNTHMVIEAHKSVVFKDVVNNSTFSFSDGMPLVYFMKKKYKIIQDRIAGIDFMLDAICECEKEKLSVFFLGSSENVLSKLKNTLLKKFPQLHIAGMISPPYAQSQQYDNEKYIRQINESCANLVFVSLGCPKQEYWMAENYKSINAPLLGVGAAFEVQAGIKKRAPRWMQHSGLEWFFRFLQEPDRLWKRYLKTNTIFIYLFMISLFSKDNG